MKKTEQLIIKANDPFDGMFAAVVKIGRSEFKHPKSCDEPEQVVQWVAERLGCAGFATVAKFDKPVRREVKHRSVEVSTRAQAAENAVNEPEEEEGEPYDGISFS